jgi:hypothetical protein
MRVDRRWLVRGLLGLMGVLISACSAAVSPQATSSPIPTSTPAGTPAPQLVLTLTANRLTKPYVPAVNPSQADKGSEIYWFVCLPCHGDKGQGLTDEWRTVYGPDEMNCWQSGCHGPRHPPEGFQLPRQVPPVLGPAALSRLSTAADLYHIISTTMPWWGPDYLTAEDKWNLTAYLLRQEGTLPPGVVLDAGNAPIFQLHSKAASSPQAEQPYAVLTIGLLALGTLALVVQRVLRR